MGSLVGCGLPPVGSSVIASALVFHICSGGFSTTCHSLPSASGQSVCIGMGLPPCALGISHNWKTRSCLGMGTFCPIRRSEEHTSELQSLRHLVCRLLLEKK